MYIIFCKNSTIKYILFYLFLLEYFLIGILRDSPTQEEKREEVQLQEEKTMKEEAEKYISLGDFGYFKSDFVEFGNDMIKSKALDDRLGCAIMLELLQEKSKFNYTGVFTVQEEIGTRGATTSAYTVKPDYAIVIETTTASDIPDTPENKKVCKVGKGAVVSFMDRGTIYNKDLYKLQPARQVQKPSMFVLSDYLQV